MKGNGLTGTGYGSTIITPGSAYGDGETDAHGRETLTNGLADWNGILFSGAGAL